MLVVVDFLVIFAGYIPDRQRLLRSARNSSKTKKQNVKKRITYVFEDHQET